MRHIECPKLSQKHKVHTKEADDRPMISLLDAFEMNVWPHTHHSGADVAFG